MEVLVVVVQLVLTTEQAIDDFGINRVGRLHLHHVVEPTEPTGDVATGQRFTFEGRDDAHHVDGAIGGDHRDPELIGGEPECFRGEDASVLTSQALQFARYRLAVHTARRDHEERCRVYWHQGAWRQHRPLHTLLAPVGEERREIAEVAELLVEFRALGADGDGFAHLGDDHADFTGGHLHPGVLAHLIDRPQLEPHARHEECRLIAGLPLTCHRVPVSQASAREPLVHQTHLSGPDDTERLHHHHSDSSNNNQ